MVDPQLPTPSNPDYFIAALGSIVGALAAFVVWLNAKPSLRTPLRLLTNTFTAAFWGGITAWGITSLWPTIDRQLLCVIVAVLSHGGTEFTVSALKRLLAPWIGEGEKGEVRDQR